MVVQQELVVATRGRGSYDVTPEVERIIAASGVEVGLCNIFIRHTSASLMLCENADPDVRRDLETFMADLAPDGDRRWRHQSEGPDDMSAHIRTLVTGNSLSLPITAGRSALGTWQGVYVWEHRTAGFQRMLTITVSGDR